MISATTVIRLGPICALSISLAGCAEPEAEMPAQLYQNALSAGLAQQIGEQCDSIEFVSENRDALVAETAQDLAGQGYSQADIEGFAANLPREQLTADVLAYLAKHEIDVQNPASFCAAGEAEIEADSTIGKLLKKA